MPIDEKWSKPKARCVQVESPGRIVRCETSTANARECDRLEPRARFHLIAFRSSSLLKYLLVFQD
jgi:hypothetical protein